MTSKELIKIVDLLLDKTRIAMSNHDLTLDVTQEAKEYLLEKGTDLKYGARPLRRAIQKYIEDEIAERILTGEFSNGKEIEVSLVDDKLVFKAK